MTSIALQKANIRFSFVSAIFKKDHFSSP